MTGHDRVGLTKLTMNIRSLSEDGLPVVARVTVESPTPITDESVPRILEHALIYLREGGVSRET